MMFPSPHGDKFQLDICCIQAVHKRFRPLTGINFNRKSTSGMPEAMEFPSPHGDKFQRWLSDVKRPIASRFRPLTGINFNLISLADLERPLCFRPLTGINFNG